MSWYKIAQNKEELWIAATLDGAFTSQPASKEEALEKQKKQLRENIMIIY